MCASDQGCVGCILKVINALKVECKLNLILERKKQSLVNLIKYILFQSSSPRGRFTGFLVWETLRCHGTFVYHGNGSNEFGPKVHFKSEAVIL